MLNLLMVATMPLWFSEAPPLPPLITVTGNAEVRAIPDMADLHFEVEIRNAKLKEALAEQAEKMKTLLVALKACGVGEGDLQTSQVIINPVYRRDRDGREDSIAVSHYRVSQTVQCTLRDIRKVAEVTTRAIDSGANRVEQAQLRTSRRRKLMDEARTLAVRAAREKAVAMATELGAKVGRPYSIQEVRSSGFHFNGNAQVQNVAQDREAAGGEAEGVFEPGKISIQATVTVSFFLE